MEFMPQNVELPPGCLIPPEIWAFAASRNMEVKQEQKHRVIRHISDQPIDPLRGGREMHISRLPHDCFEQELIPHLERFGRIYEFRLVMNSPYETKGFVFVRFCDANFNQLLQVLNDNPIRQEWHLHVTECVNNCHLLLIGVPFNKTVIEIREELNRMSLGLESVRVAEGRNNQLALGNGFGQLIIASYLNYELAWIVKDHLTSRRQRMWGERIHIDWAMQTTFEFPRNYCCRRILHVLGLSSDITNAQLYRIFDEQSNGGVYHILRRDDQAFVYLNSQTQAEMAKLGIHGTMVNKSFLYVGFVNPIESSTSEEPLAMEAAHQIDLEAPGEGDVELRDENGGRRVYQEAPEGEREEGDSALQGNEEESAEQAIA